MIAFRVFIGWLLFWVFFAFRSALVVVGLFIIPVAYYFRVGDRFPKWAWIWGNDSDSIFGPPWFNLGFFSFRNCYIWTAIRNPVNNMRRVPAFNVDSSVMRYAIFGDRDTPCPKLSRVTGKPIWHLTLVHQNRLYYPSFWLIYAYSETRHFRIRLGWKCSPDWICRPKRIRESVGLTFQLLPFRKG